MITSWFMEGIEYFDVYWHCDRFYLFCFSEKTFIDGCRFTDEPSEYSPWVCVCVKINLFNVLLGKQTDLIVSSSATHQQRTPTYTYCKVHVSPQHTDSHTHRHRPVCGGRTNQSHWKLTWWEWSESTPIEVLHWSEWNFWEVPVWFLTETAVKGSNSFKWPALTV